MVFAIYQLLYLVLSPIILLFLLSRKDTRKRIKHMFGLFEEENKQAFPDKNTLWIHAVSFGEAKIALEFLKQGIQSNQVPKSICFTTTIEDAMIWFQQESKTLLSTHKIYYYFLPLDFYPIISSFIKKIKAKSLYICETDFWPATLRVCKSSQIPCYLVNGRISKSLSSNFRKIQKSSIETLLAIEMAFVQYPSDKDKLAGLIKLDKIFVHGNAKFDLLKRGVLNGKYQSLKSNSRQVCILGSFHPDEYQYFTDSFKKFHEKILFVIVPRNLNTIPKLITILKKNKLSFSLSSKIEQLKINENILIIDEMGVLSHLYQYSQISVVGGTFNQIGGHNFLEPILYKKPVLIGPFIRNYHHDAQEFLKLQFIWQVKSSSEIQKFFSQYLNKPKPFIEKSLQANQHLQKYQGVLKKTWETINLK
ncbi:MAG: hypothetical protein COB02_08495 [Candidatus Cloacimonadota bacterium]|nr:MAG: hypothetical protein COB02_08495 [Candidatus Cloacimonadota bacterium]